jgi:mRNA interferase MazF
MIRGDICWYHFQPPDKRRPVLVLTRDSARPYLSEVTVAPVTTRIRDVPSEVLLGPDDGIEQECAVNLYHLQTVPKSSVGRVITHLGPARMAEVRAALLFALGFEQ